LKNTIDRCECLWCKPSNIYFFGKGSEWLVTSGHIQEMLMVFPEGKILSVDYVKISFHRAINDIYGSKQSLGQLPANGEN